MLKHAKELIQLDLVTLVFVEWFIEIFDAHAFCFDGVSNFLNELLQELHVFFYCFFFRVHVWWMCEVDEDLRKGKLLIWIVTTCHDFDGITFYRFVFVEVMVVKVACFVANLAKQGITNVYFGILDFTLWSVF